MSVAATAVLGSVLSEVRFAAAALGAVMGAAAFDTASQIRAAQAFRWLILGAGLPLLMWTGHLLGLALTQRVAWTVELWAVVVLLSGLAGAALVDSTSAGPARTS